jgi:hypothetical protein
MFRIQVILAIMLAVLLGGCASTLQARNVQPSGFLGDYRSLLQDKGSEEGALKTYRNPAVDWLAYRKILLEPVTIWGGFSSTLSKEQQEDLQRLADSFYNALSRKLSKDYDMVETPTPGAMRIQVAVTSAEKSWLAPAFLSKVSLELQAVNTLWRFASGKPAFAGEMTIEFTVHDAQTGELLIAGADRRVGGQTLLDKEVFNSWGDVKNSLAFWTDLSVYRLCKLRQETACVQPKA